MRPDVQDYVFVSFSFSPSFSSCDPFRPHVAFVSCVSFRKTHRQSQLLLLPQLRSLAQLYQSQSPGLVFRCSFCASCAFVSFSVEPMMMSDTVQVAGDE